MGKDHIIYMDTLSIPVILGTAREGRASEKVARFVFEELNKQEGVETVFIDVRDHVTAAVTTPPWGTGGANEKPTPWKEVAEKADAFILVIPEYNRGYPGELKLFLDSLHDDYDKKPVALCGVSSGIFGGARVLDHIKPVLVELKMTPIRSALHFPKIKEAFNEKGDPTDEKARERAAAVFADLIAHAQALKALRT